jgi:hypothetical protein
MGKFRALFSPVGNSLVCQALFYGGYNGIITTESTKGN